MAFPTTLDTDFGTLVDNDDDIEASQMNEIRRAVEGLEERVGIDTAKTTLQLAETGETIQDIVYNFFETGRRLWLYEDAEPTGWELVASVADRVLAVKGGSNAFNVVGGNQAGTWTQPSHTHTGVSHVHKWYDHKGGYLHDYTYNASGVAGPITLSNTNAYRHIDISISSSSSTLNDSYTSAAGTGATGSSGTASTWRPYGAVGIIVEKD